MARLEASEAKSVSSLVLSALENRIAVLTFPEKRLRPGHPGIVSRELLPAVPVERRGGCESNDPETQFDVEGLKLQRARALAMLWNERRQENYWLHAKTCSCLRSPQSCLRHRTLQTHPKSQTLPAHQPENSPSKIKK